MSLRRRVTIMSALVVGATLVLASVVCYLVMRGELRGQVDDSLRDQGRQTARIPPNPANARDFPRRVPAAAAAHRHRPELRPVRHRRRRGAAAAVPA